MNNLKSNPILTFAQAMQKELDENSYKGNWRVGYPGFSPKVLLKRLKEETEEIEAAITTGQSIDKVITECADVSNFAMMIANNYEIEKKVK